MERSSPRQSDGHEHPIEQRQRWVLCSIAPAQTSRLMTNSDLVAEPIEGTVGLDSTIANQLAVTAIHRGQHGHAGEEVGRVGRAQRRICPEPRRWLQLLEKTK